MLKILDLCVLQITVFEGMEEIKLPKTRHEGNRGTIVVAPKYQEKMSKTSHMFFVSPFNIPSHFGFLVL